MKTFTKILLAGVVSVSAATSVLAAPVNGYSDPESSLQVERNTYLNPPAAHVVKQHAVRGTDAFASAPATIDNDRFSIINSF